MHSGTDTFDGASYFYDNTFVGFKANDKSRAIGFAPLSYPGAYIPPSSFTATEFHDMQKDGLFMSPGECDVEGSLCSHLKSIQVDFKDTRVRKEGIIIETITEK